MPAHRIVPLLLVLPLLALPVGAGDKDLAKLMFKKGEAAKKAKNYEEAADLYRRAIDEDPPFPEAALGLGQALEKLGKIPEAIEAYLECRDAVAGLDPPSRKLARLAKDADKAVARLGKDYAALQAIDAEYAKKFYALGRRHKKSSAGWAKRAFLVARHLAPGDERIGKCLTELEDVAPALASAGRFEPLIPDDAMPN
ncbi:MAG: tetratricopeptide repeat protein, partial [Planctomycetota bacterium]